MKGDFPHNGEPLRKEPTGATGLARWTRRGKRLDRTPVLVGWLDQGGGKLAGRLASEEKGATLVVQAGEDGRERSPRRFLCLRIIYVTGRGSAR